MLIVYIQNSTGIHGQSIQEIERKGGHLSWKGGCQIPLFIDNMVLRMEHLKDFIRTLMEPIWKVTGLEINAQKLQ